MDADSRLEIAAGTGTDLHLPVAGLGGRAYAFVIDLHVRGLLAFGWWIVAGMLSSGRFDPRPPTDVELTDTYVWLVFVAPVAIWFLYHPVLEVALRGRTPGKRWAGIRIVGLDGRTAGPGALLVRNLLRVVDALPAFYAVGVLCCLLTRRQARIGDVAAGTLLVYDRDAPAADDFEAPSAVGAAALAADLLRRWPSLAPAVRAELARRLLARAGRDAAPGLADADLRAELELVARA